MATISLSLISHTNAGKTTLARTLLTRDVGEVRDAPHVTEFAEDYPLITTPEGDALVLWDTPGFGDSVRLVKRLKAEGNPIGWFMREVWDRFRDRAFYASQTAMRNVRENADVVLYLIDATQTLESAGYIDSEMELLAWMDKPVVVLLNQLGTPREARADAADVERWRAQLRRWPLVLDVMPLDAFTRCWVQELRWLDAVERAVPQDKREAMTRLNRAWQAERWKRFDASMDELAQGLAATAALRETIVGSGGMRGTVRQLGAAAKSLWQRAAQAIDDTRQNGDGSHDGASATSPPTSPPTSALPPEAEAAQRALATRTDAIVQQSVARLIALHGLGGQASSELQAILSNHCDVRLRLDEGKSAMVGGVLTGALGGLVADVGSGGLTLGGGMITGAVLGAAVSAMAARGINMKRGAQASTLAWSNDALDAMVEATLLRYVAVSHYGRGRGDWRAAAVPDHWRRTVQEVLASDRESWREVWRIRSSDETSPIDGMQAAAASPREMASSTPAAPTAFVAAIRGPLVEAATAVLADLYPEVTLKPPLAAGAATSEQRPTAASHSRLASPLTP